MMTIMIELLLKTRVFRLTSKSVNKMYKGQTVLIAVLKLTCSTGSNNVDSSSFLTVKTGIWWGKADSVLPCNAAGSV